MTDWRTLDAGPELDALIAKTHTVDDPRGPGRFMLKLPTDGTLDVDGDVRWVADFSRGYTAFEADWMPYCPFDAIPCRRFNSIADAREYAAKLVKTAIDWRTLPAGPELDAIVAERVFGWKRVREWWCDNDTLNAAAIHHVENFRPTTTWHGLGLVVERMHALLYGVTMFRSSLDTPFKASFYHGSSSHRWPNPMEADTAPLAVCRAALAALESK